MAEAAGRSEDPVPSRQERLPGPPADPGRESSAVPRTSSGDARTTIDVVVLGSANVDLVLSVERIPRPGETVLARGRTTHAGGKGVNQAVAAARCGASTAMVARIGADEPGELLEAALAEAGVATSAVARSDTASGVAMIVVQASGENTIVVEPGANAELTSLDGAGADVVRACRVLVAQLEVPLSVVRQAAGLARASGATVVLNAAPARPLDDDLLDQVDVLVVNEHEAVVLAGHGAGPAEAARSLLGEGRQVVVTLGAAGALHLTPDGTATSYPGLPADVVDTTGAGDTFVGVLAASLALGLPTPRALQRAVAAGALAVETAGAVPSIPTRAAVDARLQHVGG